MASAALPQSIDGEYFNIERIIAVAREVLAETEARAINRHWTHKINARKTIKFDMI